MSPPADTAAPKSVSLWIVPVGTVTCTPGAGEARAIHRIGHGPLRDLPTVDY